MKILVGLDLVDCARFTTWSHFSDQRLRKIFSPAEIAYCRNEPLHSAARFAARFATREALYKALQHLVRDVPMPFLSFCRAIEVIKLPSGCPTLTIDPPALEAFYHTATIVDVSLSLSHTATTAGAVVMVTLRQASGYV